MSSQSVRSYDGSFNNVLNPEWGSAGDILSQRTSIGFADGYSDPGGLDRPNPREISNELFSQETSTLDVKNLSDFVWVFGQFIDHDISFVFDDHTEPLLIEIPSNDKVFIPGGPPIPMFRSLAQFGTGNALDNPRRYHNEVSAFIDGSAIYGSSQTRANWLRTFEDGKLKVSEGNNLPWNTIDGEFNGAYDRNAPHMDNPVGLTSKLYVTGDARANENPLLLTFHTLFHREHNRLCDELKVAHPDWDDEQLYQTARRFNGAFIQSITYNEWLPAMGITLAEHIEYIPELNPQIMNVFSAAAFRVGHTLINSELIRLEGNGDEIPSGNISLRDSYFNPIVINFAGGIDPYLRGMATQVQQKMDSKIIDDVRNFLFGQPSQGGLDLAAININRGRERGLSDYNTIRSDFGLPRIKEFEEITKHQEVADQLRKLYSDIDNIDPWVGMLSEDYMPDAILGSTLMMIIERQFQLLRDGDRFYFEADRAFSTDEVQMIKSTTMRDIIMRNTDIDIMQQNVFQAMPVDMLDRGPQLEEFALNAEAFPNPTSGAFEIKIFSDQVSDVEVTIFDGLGRKVYTANEMLNQGFNFIQCDIQANSAGNFYNVLITQGSENYRILRVIKG